MDMIWYREEQGNPITAPPYQNEYNLRDNELGANLIWNIYSPGNNLLRTGLQYRRISIDDWTLKPAFGPGATLKDTLDMKSIFAENEQTVNEQLKIDYGLRYDKPSDRTGGFSVSMGAERKVKQGITHFAHLSSGINIPSYEEIEARGLKTGRSYHLDLGSNRQLSNDTLLSTSVFFSSISDITVPFNWWYYTNPPSSQWGSKQEDQKLWGLDLSTDWRTTKKSAFFANYTYFAGSLTTNNRQLSPPPSGTTVIKPPESILSNAPKHRINLGWRYNDPDRKLRASLTARYVSNYLGYGGYIVHPTPVDSYLVCDGKVSYGTASNGEWYLFIGNLFNRSYETMAAFPSPGRNYTLGYSMTF